jgi:glycosyltransferase involved in cell wall biosynthesis
LLDFVFQSVDDFITHSEQDRSLLLDSFPGKRVRTVPLPDPAVLLDTSYRARDGSTILFFGVVRPYKGLSVLLRATARAREEVECRLRVAGEFYEAEDQYREIIREEGLSSCVHIDNRYIPNEEIASLFDGADVLVLPYLSATQSGVARMALAAGLPIIATRVGGLSEAVIENVTGLLVPPGNAEALGATIARYFKCGLGPVLSRSIRSAVSADRYLLARTVEEIAANNSRDAN